MLRHLTVQCFVSLPRHDELIQMVTLFQGSLIITKHNYIYLESASDTGILRKKKNLSSKDYHHQETNKHQKLNHNYHLPKV